jgi:hypothetical protein
VNPDNPRETRPRSPSRTPSITIKEQPAKQDHRSFAANMFGTMAFKMMEWFAPNNFEHLAKKASEIPRQESSADGPLEPTATDVSPIPQVDTAGALQESLAAPPPSPVKAPAEPKSRPASDHMPAPSRTSSTKPANTRRNSNATVRAPKPKRRLSEPFISSSAEDIVTPLTSPILGNIHPEKLPRPPKPGQPRSDTLQNVPASPGSSDGAEIVQVRSDGESKPFLTRKLSHTQIAGPKDGPQDRAKAGRGRRSIGAKERKEQQTTGERLSGSPDDVVFLPQSLSQLNFDIVEFLFGVLREDRSFESPSLEPRGQSWHLQPSKLKRQSIREQCPVARRREWKRFVEQSVFHVLSDPHALLQSFTKDGKLVDSRTLWRCMVRLVDAAPSLVFHSLWMAAESLFAVPPYLRDSRPAGAESEPSLSSVEAGYLMSICLHALVAAAPEVTDLGVLYELSRLRSNGIVLAGYGTPSQIPTSLCLEYDDAFSNALTLRLARRLFSAIIARDRFVTVAKFDRPAHNSTELQHVLTPLLNQLDSLNSDAEIAHDAPIPQSLPLLLLDWARAVLLQEWDGQAEFNPESVFAGALSLIETMCR